MDEHDYTKDILNMVVSLGGIIVCLALAAFIFKRLMKKRLNMQNEANAIKIIERRALSPKSALFLVEIEGKKFVISESSAGVHLIGDLPFNENLNQEKESTKETPSFATILKQKLKLSPLRLEK